MNNPYLPKEYKILDIKPQTDIDVTYKIAYEGKVVGGQFMEISIPGVGEAPISISDFDDASMDMTIRKVGRLTDKIFDLKVRSYVRIENAEGHSVSRGNCRVGRKMSCLFNG